MARTIVYFLLTSFLYSPASASEDLVIGDWLTTVDDDTCWMAAHPFSQPSSEVGRKYHQDIYFNVAFQNGSPQPVLSVPLDGFEYAYNYISKKCNFRNSPSFFRKLSSIDSWSYFS